jgi:hypothetical protein
MFSYESEAFQSLSWRFLRVQFQTVMPSLAWPSTRFAGVAALETGCGFNPGDFVKNVLMLLSEQWGEGRTVLFDGE